MSRSIDRIKLVKESGEEISSLLTMYNALLVSLNLAQIGPVPPSRGVLIELDQFKGQIKKSFL